VSGLTTGFVAEEELEGVMQEPLESAAERTSREELVIAALRRAEASGNQSRNSGDVSSPENERAMGSRIEAMGRRMSSESDCHPSCSKVSTRYDYF
jgi:hypothetical protein